MSSFPPKSVLVPTDLSETSMSALRYARVLHERFEAKITVIHAERIEMPPYFTEAQEAALVEAARDARRHAVAEVGRAASAALGFVPDTRIVEGYPSNVVLDTAGSGDYDLLVLGTHGRTGPSRLWLGSVTERVMRASPVPVLAVRAETPALEVERVFCPVSAGDSSERALAYAVTMAESLGAELHVLRAVGEPGFPVADCASVSAAMRSRCDVTEQVIPGNPVEAFVNGARASKADVIVMGGQHPDSLLVELFSTTSDVILRKLAIPLVVVPA